MMDDQVGQNPVSRRGFLGATAATAAAAATAATGALAMTGLSAGQARAATTSVADEPVPLIVAAESPWQVNQVGLTDWNLMFVSGPRAITPDQVTPSLARREADGSFSPFPGNSWNEWQPGNSGLDQFVNLITLNVFWDNTVWVCDWGAPMSDSSATPVPGAQKVVQLDPVTGKILEVLRFDGELLPAGSELNDIQVNGNHMYIADSGVGAIIYRDMSTRKTVRRMSGYPEVTATAAELEENPPPPGFVGTPPDHIDAFHCTSDGSWLYWAPPEGPIRRCRAGLVRDTSITDDELAARVEFVADITTAPGMGMDSLGNIYLSDADNSRFDLMPVAPRNGAEREIIQLSESSTLMNSPDDIFIGVDRRLYACCSQFQLGTAATAPWRVFSIQLPEVYQGYPLGDEDNGWSGPGLPR